MSQAPPSAKMCVKCGEDCSQRRRTKDPQGRYICQECLTKMQTARAAATPAPVAAPPEDEGVFALDDAAIAEAAAAAAKAAPPRSCANCGMLLLKGAVICTRCGLNTSTGKILGTDKKAGAGKTCSKCGYSLEGLAAPVCPECGTINTKEDRRRAQDRKDSRAIARNELIKPVVYFGVSVGIILMVAAFAGVNVERALAALAIRYAVSVPIGCVVYFMCGMMWIGFDAPWRYTILRLAAAFAISDAALFTVGLIPFGLFRLAIPVFVMGYAIHSLMDLELTDGIIIAVLLFIVQIGVMVAIQTNM